MGDRLATIDMGGNLEAVPLLRGSAWVPIQHNVSEFIKKIVAEVC